MFSSCYTRVKLSVTSRLWFALNFSPPTLGRGMRRLERLQHLLKQLAVMILTKSHFTVSSETQPT